MSEWIKTNTYFPCIPYPGHPVDAEIVPCPWNWTHILAKSGFPTSGKDITRYPVTSSRNLSHLWPLPFVHLFPSANYFVPFFFLNISQIINFPPSPSPALIQATSLSHLNHHHCLLTGLLPPASPPTTARPSSHCQKDLPEGEMVPDLYLNSKLKSKKLLLYSLGQNPWLQNQAQPALPALSWPVPQIPAYGQRILMCLQTMDS